ncbi:IclR family transcriptional regulator [Achromobacter sp. RTa]|uniref:IclR family transcriptional regulator n=1 Tax=Achromobacter sp. RTa TaxID=1532557 RepID=UPI00050FB79D|nr:IclR family transcriptional regulator [Achromobacter sp. RTa]KGD87933.1 IclR family transcriptional regulator [Achromobacter sp. RTa]
MSNPLNRYHRILQAISGQPAGMSLADLAAATGLPRSTTHRLATSLREIEYLEVDDATGNFMLGAGLIGLMRASLTQDSKLAQFKPALNFVVGRLEETAFCARLLNDEVDLVQAITPTRKDQLYIYPGVGSRPLDKCSSSKAILAYLEPARIEALLEPLARATPGLRIADLVDELTQVHQQGFAVCDGEIDEGVLSVACPVMTGKARGLYSIGVVGPAARLKSHDIREIVSVLHSAADLAAAELLNT